MRVECRSHPGDAASGVPKGGSETIRVLQHRLTRSLFQSLLGVLKDD